MLQPSARGSRREREEGSIAWMPCCVPYQAPLAALRVAPLPSPLRPIPPHVLPFSPTTHTAYIASPPLPPPPNKKRSQRCVSAATSVLSEHRDGQGQGSENSGGSVVVSFPQLLFFGFVLCVCFTMALMASPSLFTRVSPPPSSPRRACLSGCSVSGFCAAQQAAVAAKKAT